MATKRRPLHTKLNFRPSVSDTNLDCRGTKPTSEPTSVKETFTLMVLYLCKKSLFFNTNLKVAIYLGTLFLLSLIADVSTVPKMYLSRSDNIFNKFFVKFAWGWNLTLLTPFVGFTTYIYCCGEKQRIIKHHLLRICIATFFWWFWTTLFNMIEASFGRCGQKQFNTKGSCLQAGHVWNGFDFNYKKYTPYIRGLFIAITLFQIMWDVMLVCTMLYYHIMIEKFLGGVLAILTWFFTYRVWYSHPKLFPKLPGQGVFIYIKKKVVREPPPAVRRRTGSIVNNGRGPLFMGRPIYPQQDSQQEDT
ncbi:FIT family protein, partial [Asbolus verrucosus]